MYVTVFLPFRAEVGITTFSRTIVNINLPSSGSFELKTVKFDYVYIIMSCIFSSWLFS